jgi:hypothetical protein
MAFAATGLAPSPLIVFRIKGAFNGDKGAWTRRSSPVTENEPGPPVTRTRSALPSSSTREGDLIVQ